jgi:uncharacterized membrane protein
VSRLKHIDWLRGVAVLAMIEWHTLDSWTRLGADREGPAWGVVGTIGGLAAPLFLFLAGVALPLALAAGQRRGLGRRAAAWQLQKRGWQVFGLAHLFRLQGFLLNPNASWSVLLKPDILNILGLGIVACGFCCGRGSTPHRAVAWLVGPALAIVLITPFVRLWWWPTLLHPSLEAYLRPVGNYGVFSLFPWVAIIFAGAIVGRVIAVSANAAADVRLQVRLALASLGLIASGWIGSYLPAPFGPSSFWTTSLSFFLIRIGLMTLALVAAWLWMRRPTAAHWSPLVLFGQTSLFVYWVHVELAYGVFSYPIQHTLPLPWSIAALVAFTTLMLGAAALWKGRKRPRPLVPSHLRPRQGAPLRTSNFDVRSSVSNART